MVRVRQARADDIDFVVASAARMHEESPVYRRMKFSAQKVRGVVERWAMLPEGLVLVAEDKETGARVGGMIAFAMASWLSNAEAIACDLGLWVSPEYRGGWAAARMVKEYVRWARGRGVASIQISSTTGVRLDRTAAFYAHLGFHEIGRVLEA
jgi:GNAT superfamily N-acetyltransferase